MLRPLVATVMAFFLLANAVAVEAFDQESDRATVLRDINDARASIGLAPVTANATLNSIAQWRSEDMLTDGCFSHVICDTDDYVFPRIPIHYSSAAEVITWNTYPDALSAHSAVQQWLLSAGHRAVLLGRYTIVGIGVAISGAKRMFTGIFLLPISAKPAPRPSFVLPPTDTSG